MTIKTYLARHYPAPWWRYPRGRYKLHVRETWHYRSDPVDRQVRGVRTAANWFWWAFFWASAWCGAAAVLHSYFNLPFWPAFTIFLLGEFSGRCSKDQQRALLELRGRESDLAMAKEGIRE